MDNIIIVCIEDKKTTKPKRAFQYAGKVFLYPSTTKIVISVNDVLKYIPYDEETETFTIYNYKQ